MSFYTIFKLSNTNKTLSRWLKDMNNSNRSISLDVLPIDYDAWATGTLF